MTAADAVNNAGAQRGRAGRAMAALTARGRVSERSAASRSTAELALRAGLLIRAPILVSCGIGLWFSLRFEPGAALYATAAMAMLLGLAVARWVLRLADTGRIGWDRAEVLRMAALGAALVLSGFLAAGLRLHLVAAPVMDYRYYGPVEGRVVQIDRSARDRMRVTLDQVVLRHTSPGRTPRRVRLSLPLDAPLPPTSARVMLTAHLGPPPAPAEPGGFDFRRTAFFAGLGAVGYTRTPILLVEPPPPRLLDGTAIRLRLSRSMQQQIGGQAGAVASALVTGDRSGIAEATNQVMRDSNLYHIVSISGLHMTMLAGFVYAALRLALAAVQGLGPGVLGAALAGAPVHKLAALAALAAATLYLWVSGGGVPTERAWVMVAVMLAAVLLDRRAISLRTLAVAALVILYLAPEALVTPGFQMSFAATAALILLFPAWSRGAQRLPWVVRGATLLVISSLIAGLATAPIAAAHFNRSAQYGIVANLLVVPVMGSVVMPAGVIAALLAPVGLAGPALWAMGLGTRWMLWVAETVSGWGGSVLAVPAPDWRVLPLGAAGVALWLFSLQGATRATRWLGRGAAVLLTGAAALLWAASPRPDILIAPDAAVVGILTPAGRALSKPGGAFAADSWLHADGDTATVNQAGAREGWSGPSAERRAVIGGIDVIHLTGKTAATRAGAACSGGAVVIVAARVPPGVAGDCLLIEQAALSRSGARAGWLRDGELHWLTDASMVGERLWSSPAERRRRGLSGRGQGRDPP